ncbi:zinc finger protein 410-like [Asterias rubens]|uniref:zinc finger protein 410-like n=1 Tax=Asterias rubens TaxID=7604 RepID=UPI0014552FCE|nr:zinc finger protein 410-like [Asterias rubens]
MDPVINTSDVLASSLDSLATSIACGATSILEDSVASTLMLTNHGVASSLGISQANLGLNDIDGNGSSGIEMGANQIENSFPDCTGDLDGQDIVGGDETDGTDMTNLGLSQSSYMLFNLPNSNPTSAATTTFMPIMVLSTSNAMLKANGVEPNLILDRPQQDLSRLLRLRDLAHANLICATQESIAKSSWVTNQTTEEKFFKCEECGRNFKSSSHYRYHCETHKGNKVLKCPMEGCNRRFAWPAHLKYHTRTHANDRPYSCSMDGCGKTFYTVQSLHVHMRTHTGHKPFKCSEEGCGKSFTTAGNLKNHSRIHTGERPFICDHEGCIQSFAEHSSLRKHKLTHTGEKPYECEICFKVFSQSGSRNTHKRRHHSKSKSASSRGDRKIRDGTREKQEAERDTEINCNLLGNHQGTTQHEIELEEITLPNPEHSNATLPTMTTVSVSEADMHMSSHSSMPEHDGISLAHSMLAGVTLNSHHQDSSSGHVMQSEQDNMTMLGHNGIVGHDSLTLSHSILEVTTDLEHGTSCKADCDGSNARNVVVLTQPNHNHDHTLSMITDASQFPVSHQTASAEDMVYNNAMLPSAAHMVDQDHGGHDVDIPVSEIEVSGHHHHHHHHDLQGGDIVITW